MDICASIVHYLVTTVHLEICTTSQSSLFCRVWSLLTIWLMLCKLCLCQF